jgi:hypothetical protein
MTPQETLKHLNWLQNQVHDAQHDYVDGDVSDIPVKLRAVRDRINEFLDARDREREQKRRGRSE